MAVAGYALISVVIVVPAFAPGQQTEPRQVLAVVGSFVIAVDRDAVAARHEGSVHW
jgi:hypothetical protein